MNRFRQAIVALAALFLLVPAALAAEDQQTVRGRIQEVRPSTKQLLLTTEGGKELTLRVDDRSRLQQQGKEVALDQFKKGMRVQAVYESRDGGNRLVSLTPALVSAAEVQKEIRDALQAAGAYTYQHRDEYRRRLQNVLDQVNDRIEQLQSQAARAGAEARKEYAEQIDQLRRLRDKVETQAERVKSATPKAWDDLKSGVGAALEDLRKAFEKAGERFR